MARKNKMEEEKDALTQYTFEEEKRLNIPQTGLVSAETDPINGSPLTSFILLTSSTTSLKLVRDRSGKPIPPATPDPER